MQADWTPEEKAINSLKDLYNHLNQEGNIRFDNLTKQRNLPRYFSTAYASKFLYY